MGDKKIVALSDFEHILLRPTMYVGSIDVSEEKVQVIRDDKLVNDVKEISVGFYKLADEILSNAFDEAKRQKGAMKRIEIHFYTKDNSVKVIDTGGGFINASHLNEKTGVANVETAMTMLRAGSNFYNDSTSENLIGTNGVGASVVNMLSDKFSIKTINAEEHYEQTWEKFECKNSSSRPKKTTEHTGTEILFVPRKDKFKECKWDKEYIHTLMTFKQFLKKHDPEIKGLEFLCFFDDEKLDVNTKFLPDETIVVENRYGSFFLWESYQNSGSVSFVNGAQCTGIHQRILLDHVNNVYENPLAGRFYESFIMLNLPPKYVRFGDQNKTKFVTSRSELSPLLEKNFFPGIKREIRNSPIYDNILKKISDAEKESDMRTLKTKKRVQKTKISDKYFPPSMKTKNLYIVEGGCIEENTPILILTDTGISSKLIKDVQIGETVLTHRNRFREVNMTSKKISKKCTIKLVSGEELNCSHKHPWFVYDTENLTFSFIPSDELDKQKHKLVRNHLAFFEKVARVKHVEIIENSKYPVCITHEDGVQYATETHKYCIYDENESLFKMIEAKNIEKGNFIAIFNF